MPTLDEVFSLAPRGKFLFKITPRRRTLKEARALVLSVAQPKPTGEALDRRARALMLQGPEMTPPPEEFARMVLEEGSVLPGRIPPAPISPCTCMVLDAPVPARQSASAASTHNPTDALRSMTRVYPGPVPHSAGASMRAVLGLVLVDR